MSYLKNSLLLLLREVILGKSNVGKNYDLRTWGKDHNK